MIDEKNTIKKENSQIDPEIEQLFNAYKNNLSKDNSMKQSTWDKVSSGLDADKAVSHPKKGKAGLWAFLSVVMVLLVATVSSLASIYKSGWNNGNKSNILSELKYPSSCSQLSSQFEKYKDVNSNMYWGGMDDIMKESDLAAMGTASPESESSGSSVYHSDTNVQVKGIDEGDIVKTDGKYLYIMKSSRDYIDIVKVYPYRTADKVGTIEFSDEVTGTEMYINDNNLVVISSKYAPMVKDRDSNYVSMISVYDINNPSNPDLVREFNIEGSFITSRMKDNFVYLVASSYPMNINDPIPLYQDSKEHSGYKPSCECNDIGILDDSYIYPTFTSVITLDLQDVEDSTATVNNFVGDTINVYMSHENIYLISERYPGNFPVWGGIIDGFLPEYSDYITVITKLGYQDQDVSFVGQSQFEGTFLNQFSLDEYDGYLRVVGTKGSTWDDTSESFLITYDKDMNQVSMIDKLAKGESVYAVRFYEDTGVVVTFKQTDPLFVFDLSDPENPELKGELKIPGFSDYLHFIDEDTVLGIGKDAVPADGEWGYDFAWYQGLKIAVFDISDMSNPKQISSVAIGDRGTSSPALYDHKAIVFDEKHDKIIIPVLEAQVDMEYCKMMYGTYDADLASCYGDNLWQGTVILGIDDDGKLSEDGTISHYPLDYEGYYSDYDRYSIYRNVVVEDAIVSISDGYVMINDLDSLDELNTVDLEYVEPEPYYWDYGYEE